MTSGAELLTHDTQGGSGGSGGSRERHEPREPRDSRTPRPHRARTRRRTILGLILIPLTVAGLFLWGLWDPQDRLDTMTAAVVNLDEPVEIDGQPVPLGRLLAGELIGAPDEETVGFAWVLTDEAEAAEGLDGGRYATVVTIPENFSAAATSASRDPGEAETATIDIESGERGRLLDTALSGIVTSTATTLLNQQLGEQFVGGVFVGMNDLGEGVGDAAEGAGELADGGDQLAKGASAFAEGAGQLAAGTQELSTGAGSLSSGAFELAAGAGELSSGASELSSGASDLATGMRTFASGDGQGNPGMAGLATNVETYTSGVNAALTGLRAGAAGAVDPLIQYRDAIAAGLIPLPPDADQATVIAELDRLIGGLQDPDAQARLDELVAGGTQLAQGTRAAATGADRLAAGAEGLAGGAGELATGASGLSSGASALSGGASQLSGGVSQLAGQTPELASGAEELADGTEQSATGARTLADGLTEAHEQIPSTTESERDRLAQTAVQPVEARGAGDELFSAAGVPLFAAIALWAGALGTFLMLAPLWRRARGAARGVGAIALRSAVPALGIGALQGALAGIVLPVALGYGLGQGAAFFGLALVAGAAFGLFSQGLAAFFGGIGRFLAFALLVVVFAASVVSTAPEPLRALSDGSPVGVAYAGFQAVAAGAPGAVGAVFALILWGLAGLALTAFAVARLRRRGSAPVPVGLSAASETR